MDYLSREKNNSLINSAFSKLRVLRPTEQHVHLAKKNRRLLLKMNRNGKLVLPYHYPCHHFICQTNITTRTLYKQIALP